MNNNTHHHIQVPKYKDFTRHGPGMVSPDSIRQYVMKLYRAGRTELLQGLESWNGPFIYEKNGETYVCGYKVFNPHKLISNLQFNVNHALICKMYANIRKHHRSRT